MHALTMVAVLLLSAGEETNTEAQADQKVEAQTDQKAETKQAEESQ